MATYIKTLTDGSNQILPRTAAEAVQTSSGVNLETILNSVVATKADLSSLLSCQTVELLVNNWDATSLTQTVNVSNVTASSVVMPSPAPTHQVRAANSMVYCVDQGNGTLTFACKKVPTQDILFNVLVLGV